MFETERLRIPVTEKNHEEIMNSTFAEERIFNNLIIGKSTVDEICKISQKYID